MQINRASAFSAFYPVPPRFGTARPSTPTTQYMQTIDYPGKNLQKLAGEVNNWRFWQGDAPLGNDEIQWRRHRSHSDSPHNTHLPPPVRPESQTDFRIQLAHRLRAEHPGAYQEHAVEVVMALNNERMWKGRQPIPANLLPRLIREGIEEAKQLDRLSKKHRKA